MSVCEQWNVCKSKLKEKGFQTVNISVSLTLRSRALSVFLISSKSDGLSSSCRRRLMAMTVFGFLKL